MFATAKPSCDDLYEIALFWTPASNCLCQKEQGASICSLKKKKKKRIVGVIDLDSHKMRRQMDDNNVVLH
jgi:hypothetical protein